MSKPQCPHVHPFYGRCELYIHDDGDHERTVFGFDPQYGEIEHLCLWADENEPVKDWPFE